MKTNRWIESWVIFCCSSILLCLAYLFWDQYSTAVKAGDIGVLIAAIGAFITAGIFYFQFKETNRRLSQQRDDNQKLQDQFEEERRLSEESRRQFQEQFQEQFKESQERIQERIQETQKLSVLARDQFKESQDQHRESQRQFQELFNESRRQYEELFQKSQDIHIFSQKLHEESRERFSLVLYRHAFSSLYDPKELRDELISDAESSSNKSAHPALLEILELIRVNLLDQVIDESAAKRSLKLALYDDFHGLSPIQSFLLKYQLRGVLLKYGLYLLKKDDENSDLQKRQKFLEIIFKMKMIRVKDITAANIKNKLDIMAIANRV